MAVVGGCHSGAPESARAAQSRAEQSRAAPGRAAPSEARSGAASRQALDGACALAGPERCNAQDDNCNGLIDEGCGIPSGIVQFAISWEEADADVDLNVVDPGGELAETGRITEANLTKQRDCPGLRNQCDGRNTENVYLTEDEASPGEYQVVVRLERLGKAPPPLRVVLSARVGNQRYAYAMLLHKEEQEHHLAFTY